LEFAARRAHDKEAERGADETPNKDDNLSLYAVELKSLPEETDALQYWHLKEAQYASISKLALDLVRVLLKPNKRELAKDKSDLNNINPNRLN